MQLRQRNYLKKIGFKNGRVMVWPPFLPDLNIIENLWSIIKRKICVSGRQFPTKTELWDATSSTADNISRDEIQKLTNSMDKRLISVISNHGGYIHMQQ